MQRTEPVLVKLTDVADIVRCDGKTRYPQGTCYFYASATDKQPHFLEEEEILSDRCAVVVPKQKCHPMYLFIVLEYFSPAFMHKYVSNLINLPLNRFKHFEMLWFYDYAMQERIIEAIKPSMAVIAKLEETLQVKQTVSRWWQS